MLKNTKRGSIFNVRSVDHWLFLGVGLLSTFFFFNGDQLTTVGHSVTFWHSILKGNLTGGYQECLDVIYTSIPHRTDVGAVYEPLAYIIVGILNMPLIILNEIGCLNFQSSWYGLYIKIEQWLLVCGTAYVIYKICLELKCKSERAKYAAYLFSSSVGIIYYAIIIGQMEIYVVFFTVVGIYYWMKDDNFKFILFFAIAIPLKLFALLIFFPLILIKQKKVYKVLIDLLGGCSLYIVCKLIWLADDAYHIMTAEPSQRMIEALKAKQLAGGMSGGEGIPIFVCLYFLLCFFIYIGKNKSNLWGIYYSFVVYALLFIFVGHYPYWIVMLTPFLPILIAQDETKETINLLADIIMWGGHIIAALFYHSWLTDSRLIGNMFLADLFGKKQQNEIAYQNVADLLNEMQYGQYAPFCIALYVAALLALIIINYPKSDREFAKIEINSVVLHCVRILLITPLLGLMVYCYYVPKLENLIDTTGYESMDMGYDLFSEDFNKYGKNALIQEIHFDQDAEINKIDLFFSRSGSNYLAYGSLYVNLEDLTSGKILYSQRVGYNQLKRDDFTTFDVGKVEVNKNHTYAISMNTDVFHLRRDLQAYTKITKNNIFSDPLNYLGNDVSCELYMKIKGHFIADAVQ